MRQPRRSAPLGWLLALLLPLLVSGGAGGVAGATRLAGAAGAAGAFGTARAAGAAGTAGALGAAGAAASSRQSGVVRPSGDHRPSSAPVSDGGRGVLVSALAALGIGPGGGSGTSSAFAPADPWHPPAPSGTGPRPAGDDGTRSLAALLVRPGRAPPASTAS